VPAGNVVVVMAGGSERLMVIVVDFEPAVAVMTALAVPVEVSGATLPRRAIKEPTAGAV
jgi:hypothetical protein